MTESFLIHVTDGVAEVFRAKQTSAKRFDPFSRCTLEDTGIREALIGISVLGTLGTLEGGHTLGHIDVEQFVDGGGAERSQITFLALPIEPPEKTGVEYLRSLDDGVPYLAEGAAIPFFVAESGLIWSDGQTWDWDGTASDSHWDNWILQCSWLEGASAETIKPWVPK